MGRRLAENVVVHSPAGTVWCLAGEVPADDIAALILNPSVWAEGEQEEPVFEQEQVPPVQPEEAAAPQEPPRSGKGASAESWRAYAQEIGVDVDESAGRDDVIAAVDNARGN